MDRIDELLLEQPGATVARKHRLRVGLARTRAAHSAPVEYRVFPRRPLPVADLERVPAGAEPPPLVKGYLRAGAWVCGEPAWDPEFNTADFFLLLPLANVAPRYARHFLGTDLQVCPQ